MKVVENPEAAHEMLLRAREYQDTANARAAGLHISDLIMCSRMGYYRLHGFEAAPESDDFMVIVLAGQGHHSILEAGKDEKKLVLNLAGREVHGTVDVHEIVANLGVEIPVEVKTTRASSAYVAPIEHPQYSEQLASYVLGDLREVGAAIDAWTPYQGRLYALFIRGDYKKKLIDFKCWDCYWTGLELLSWESELERRTRMVDGDKLPSIREHYPWECDNCKYGPEKGSGVCEGNAGFNFKLKEHREYFRKPFFRQEPVEVEVRRLANRGPSQPPRDNSEE